MSDLSNQSIEQTLEENRKLLVKMDTLLREMKKEQTSATSDLSIDNSDEQAQDNLRFIERDLLKSREKRQELERQVAEIKQKYQTIQRESNYSLADTIQEKLLKASQEKEHLRADLIPNVIQLLEEMEHRKRELDNIILKLSKQANDLSRHQLHQDIDSDIQKF